MISHDLEGQNRKISSRAIIFANVARETASISSCATLFADVAHETTRISSCAVMFDDAAFEIVFAMCRGISAPICQFHGS